MASVAKGTKRKGLHTGPWTVKKGGDHMRRHEPSQYSLPRMVRGAQFGGGGGGAINYRVTELLTCGSWPDYRVPFLPKNPVL